MTKSLEALVASVREKMKRPDELGGVMIGYFTLDALIAALEQSQLRVVEAQDRGDDLLCQARTFREAHDSASEIIRRMECNKRVVTLPTTRLWAGKVACYEETDVINMLRVAGVNIADEKQTNNWQEDLLQCVKSTDAMREVAPLCVKLPSELIDQVCLAAAEIHNRGNGVNDDKAQFIIDRIRNYLESGGTVAGSD